MGLIDKAYLHYGICPQKQRWRFFNCLTRKWSAVWRPRGVLIPPEGLEPTGSKSA